MLIVRDDELNVGDNEVASSEVAEGGTCAGRPGEVTRICPGTTPVAINGAIHVQTRDRTSEELGIPYNISTLIGNGAGTADT